MIADPTTYAYKLVGECEIKADVYRPPSGSAGNSVVVCIHGGCLIYGRRTDIRRWQIERLLKAGHAVVSIDYRLAPETKLPGIIEDLDDALRWIVESGQRLFAFDVERLAVVGYSAGGYLALMTGFATAV
ncbi:MAG: alpha/beta hydrolase, partial [Spirochaetales bacterium]